MQLRAGPISAKGFLLAGGNPLGLVRVHRRESDFAARCDRTSSVEPWRGRRACFQLATNAGFTDRISRSRGSVSRAAVPPCHATVDDPTSASMLGLRGDSLPDATPRGIHRREERSHPGRRERTEQPAHLLFAEDHRQACQDDPSVAKERRDLAVRELARTGT